LFLFAGPLVPRVSVDQKIDKCSIFWGERLFNKNKHIGFIGAGNMASAVIRGLVNTGTPATRIIASAPSERSLNALAKTLHINTSHNNLELAKTADILVLAVKPQVMSKVCREVAPYIRTNTLILSLAAGVTCTRIESWLNGRYAIIRCMPNTPSQLQLGASGLFANSHASDEHKSLAEHIMQCVGIACWVENESLIDTVTAVAGSGPAYFYLFMEAIVDAACAQGLNRETAFKLTTQTALGAATLAQQSEDDLVTLRERVTSPEGTTEYALRSLEKDNFREVVARAINAGQKRAEELATIK